MAAKSEENSKVEEEPHEPSPTTKDDAPQPKLDDDDDDDDHHHQQSSANEPRSSSSSEEDTKQWGTHVMGPPAIPVVHPDNQKAALWVAGDHQQIHELPYLVYTPAEQPTQNSFELVINVFNTWSRKAETVARSVWHNLRSGSSVSDAAWGKVNLTAKAITKGGFESLFKKIFATDPTEKLKKAFACYLSTTTGPVAGTLYLSTARVAFCSDRPLSFVAPSGQETWTYYKVMIPLSDIGTVYPVVMKENPASESYIEVVTIDGHDFWFMGFVKFEKASFELLNNVLDFKATTEPVAA
ncbi:GEM-like protein 5 [Gossypium australe]|uniref:GEM-like protein 5 n=1 Tax=Gossypium australe TaxID=47621 RepID=A0A5B6VG58_9ROSI|nr:GEM-like protein 5 [Gossypium australe]